MSADFAPVDELVREIRLEAASKIKVRPVKWLERDKIPAGALTILGGREGVGKTLLWAEKAARVTRGELPGIYQGQPSGVIVAATEDSWAMTIVPRLMAAGADLERVYRVNVITPEGVDTSLSLPDDLLGLEELVRKLQIALVVLDPLLSRLSPHLDTHRDAEVRLALEPLVALADRTGVAVLGLIHVSKSSTSDPLTSLMGSRAFAAVARAVVYMMADPDDPDTRLVGTPKNNLGRSDLPTRSCQIEAVKVADTEEGPVWTAKIVWTGDRSESISEMLESSAETAEFRSATGEAEDWLQDYLASKEGSAESSAIKEEGKAAGHSVSSLRRAAQRLRVAIASEGYPRKTIWALPVGSRPLGHKPTEPTEPTEPTSTVSSLGSVSSVGSSTPRANRNGHRRPDEGRSALAWPAHLTARGRES